nr:MipA/OmpV family protein [Pseudoalteromonas sp. BDTF-M6]
MLLPQFKRCYSLTRVGSKVYKAGLLLVIALFSGALSASEETIYTAHSGWQFGLSAGYGEIENPIHDADDIPLYVIPKVEVFYGDFAFSNFELSWTPLSNDNHQLSFVSKMNRDGLYFIDSLAASSVVASLTSTVMPGAPRPPSAQQQPRDTKKIGDITKIRDRELSFLAGAQYLYDWQQWRLSASYFTEITHYHHGQEGSLVLSRYQQWHKHLLLAAAEIQYQSNEITKYYYGSQRQEIVAGFSRYQPEHAFNKSLQLTYQYQINEDWRFISDLKWQVLDSEIADSPLVSKQHLLSYYAGVAWSF